MEHAATDADTEVAMAGPAGGGTGGDAKAAAMTAADMAAALRAGRQTTVVTLGLCGFGQYLATALVPEMWRVTLGLMWGFAAVLVSVVLWSVEDRLVSAGRRAAQ